MQTSHSEPAFYESYWVKNDDWSPSQSVNDPEEQRLFDRWLKVGMKVIDYGCGNGERYGRDMLQRGIDYCGYDISEVALAQAASLGLKVDRIREDSTTAAETGSADAAICFEVLEHLMEPDRAVKEIFRMLKPGGQAIISVPNAAFFTQRLEFLLTGFWNPGGSPLTARKTPWRDAHIRFYHPALLRRLLESCGFQFELLHAYPLTLRAMPWFYKQTKLFRLFDTVSWPLKALSKLFPGMFSPRLFAIVRKPGPTAAS